ncbi:hypothetical protein AMECASPLE_038302 [Ameca splendens]|uniref:Uncharacterized protein n=1 Tax=Ameca splendens TaxID=208324 RepID=A0ABV0ZTN6_9TELE
MQDRVSLKQCFLGSSTGAKACIRVCAKSMCYWHLILYGVGGSLELLCYINIIATCLILSRSQFYCQSSSTQSRYGSRTGGDMQKRQYQDLTSRTRTLGDCALW